MMFFFFNDTAATEIYTLSLHDALPISDHRVVHRFLVEALVHQVNASPRRVHLLAEEHVGRAGRQAEAAVDAVVYESFVRRVVVVEGRKHIAAALGPVPADGLL